MQDGWLYAMHDTITTAHLAPQHDIPNHTTAIASYCHALRGATIVAANEPEAIYGATRELLTLLRERNEMPIDCIASAFFTVTPDIDAAFPAKAARQLGWKDVALLCATEIPVPGALTACIRVLLHFNANRPRHTYVGVYIHGAESLLGDQDDAER